MSLIKLFATAATIIGALATSLRPRDLAPDFKGVNAVSHGEFVKVSLDDYRGKYVILIFYPFDFTYVCPTELIAYSDAI